MFASIVLLVCTLGPPLIGLFKTAHSAKKLTKAQLLDGGKRLAWQVAEAQKAKAKKNGKILSVSEVTDVARDALLKWAGGNGLALSRAEVDAARAGWELLSTAAKALKK